MHAPKTIVGDSVRLTQILSDLVNNALKFTESGGIRLIVAPGAALNSVRFEVEDTGVGIPLDRLHAIFGGFTQADMSTTRKYGGTGLGLAICQRLALAMGAEIGVVSVQGCGSIFSFTLSDCADTWASWPAIEVRGGKMIVCAQGEFTRSALAHYSESAGLPTMFARPSEIVACVRPGDIVVAEWDIATAHAIAQFQQLRSRVIGIRKDEHPSPEPEAMLSWPVARPEFETLLQAIIKGRPLREANKVDADRLSGKFQGLKVLVADDSEVNREVAKEALERFGATVTVVSDGLEAVAARESSQFDLFELDGSMPVLSGFDAARNIRRREADTGSGRTPILAFAAHVLGSNATEWRNAGMDGLIAKPFTLEELSRVSTPPLASTPLREL